MIVDLISWAKMKTTSRSNFWMIMILFWRFWVTSSSRLCLFKTVWFWCKKYSSKLFLFLERFSDWQMRISDLSLTFLEWYTILKSKWNKNSFQQAWQQLSCLIVMKYSRFLWFIIISIKKTASFNSDHHFSKTWTMIMSFLS